MHVEVSKCCYFIKRKKKQKQKQKQNILCCYRYSRFWLWANFKKVFTLPIPKSNKQKQFYSLTYSYLIWNPKIFYVATPDITFRYLPKPVSILRGENRVYLFNKRQSKHDKRGFTKCFQLGATGFDGWAICLELNLFLRKTFL